MKPSKTVSVSLRALQSETFLKAKLGHPIFGLKFFSRIAERPSFDGFGSPDFGGSGSCYSGLCSVDLHLFFEDPDPAILLNSDLDRESF